ncbi:Uncharacterised protein [Yokenella regensburgei]|uniref:Antirestriction protein n=1 Tax=Yokenella regensburgei TaxID=158877 RepID=A0AB38G1B9_9ENTR|nr:Uncharacterised protein [Yokenella regensburgei]SQA95920.1 Uncharacterised protein [Yokenella regensburgei]SUQ04045.1 Uncharacterised protein [Yokenella regensburgei]
MPHIPDGVIQVPPYPLSLTHRTGCRSVSDDDLCAWCSHLLYRPGELSLCSLSLPEGLWPSSCDEDGYAHSCPSYLLNQNPQPDK